MKDNTQRVSKKMKVTGIVPGEPLSTRQCSSTRPSMDNDTSSYGYLIQDSLMHQPIPRKTKLPIQGVKLHRILTALNIEKSWITMIILMTFNLRLHSRDGLLIIGG
jgi:hypothetical protein